MSRNAFVMKYFRTISIYIIYLGLQLDGTEIPSHSRVMFSIRTIKERKLRELLSFLWFFYSFLFPIFSLFYDTSPPVISAVPSWPPFQARFMWKNLQKCSKNASERCRLGSHSEFSHESRFLTSQVTTSFSRSVTSRYRRMPKQKVTSKDAPSNSPGFEMLCHWRREAVLSGAGCDITPKKTPHAPEEAADCCTINYVSTKRIGSNLNRTEIVSNHKPIICYVFELLDKRLIGCFMIRESHCFCLFID